MSKRCNLAGGGLLSSAAFLALQTNVCHPPFGVGWILSSSLPQNRKCLLPALIRKHAANQQQGFGHSTRLHTWAGRGGCSQASAAAELTDVGSLGPGSQQLLFSRQLDARGPSATSLRYLSRESDVDGWGSFHEKHNQMIDNERLIDPNEPGKEQAIAVTKRMKTARVGNTRAGAGRERRDTPECMLDNQPSPKLLAHHSGEAVVYVSSHNRRNMVCYCCG